MQQAAESGWGDLLSEGRLPRFVLICLGVWLGAVESLITATIMPSVAGELGGHTYFGWAVAGFLVGTVLAVASAGRLSEILGLRTATALAGLILAAGCILSAAAPNMGVFLTGRLLQGMGSGWIAGFVMVAAALVFPERHLARVFASATAIWGVATVLGPLIGGLLAQAGDWRAVFWIFTLQALLFSAASVRLLKNPTTSSERTPGVPWRQLCVLGLGVSAIALADMAASSATAAAFLVLAGLTGVGLVLRIDGRAPVRLLPRGAGNLKTICGSGYASLFALTAASMGLIVYGPAILQTVRGLSPLSAGYVVAVQAMAWTVVGLAVSGASQERERRWIRLGGSCILAGVALLALLMREAEPGAVIVGAAVIGAGFGLSSSLTNRRILRALADEDRAIGSSALIAVRQTGAAVGAAIAGVAANLAGLGYGLTLASAQSVSVWVFVAALPLALAGAWAAWRLTGTAA